MKGILALLLSVFFVLGGIHAQPVLETGSVRPMPDQWIDKDTRHTVVRLSRREGDNGSFYFHNNPFVGDKMVFYGTGAKVKQIYTVDLRSLKISQVTDRVSPMGGEIVAAASKRVFYQANDSVFANNIETGETKVVFVFPPDFKGSVTTLNADETLLAGAQSGDEAKEILRQYPEKRDYFNRIFDAHIPHTLFTTDVRLLMFCHEGPWQKADRIWTIDVQSGSVTLMHKRTVQNEIAGHEFSSPDGKTIWFDWQIPKGKTFYLGGVDVQTGEEKQYQLTPDEWVAKAKVGRWIYLFHPEHGRLVSEKLVNMKYRYYKLEPNVHFSPDGKWVIFRANFEGKEGWPVITQTAKPWTRWWWMGSAVNKEDLTANMEKYQAAGLGGLEITPIYGVKGYEARFIPYLSSGWVEMLRHTLKEAGRLGLGIDMATGTGWPFGGGPLIDQNYACKNFVYKTWTLKAGEESKDTVRCVQEALVRTDGGMKVNVKDLAMPIYNNKDLQQLALFQVRFPEPLPLETLMAYSSDGKVLDLTEKVDVAGRLQWKAPSGGGDWTLYAIFQGWHGKMVERAAPGGEGNVIDHFSDTALKRYLSRWDTALAARDLLGLRAFFNDSYEVDDAKGQSNWTPGFFGLFKSYRGYDLREHLPELLGAGGRVLCDYRETISDLLLDKFTRVWGRWAQGKGAVIRNQSHGSPANILDLYAASDIPETEGSDILRYKFASSAGNVTGKPLVSAETVTWLNEHFLSSPGDVKQALDLYWLGGVNHIFYHGTAYSPGSETWPGWLFYAAVHFTPNDPCWQDLSALHQYVARCQSFLQRGVADNDVLLYYPVYDSWMDKGPDLLKHFDKMEPEFNGTGFKSCAQLLQRRGYGFDYISDKQVQALGDGVRTSGGGVYRTVVLPDCKYISAAAFEKLVELAQRGAVIVVYRSLPADVPGLGLLKERMDSLQDMLGRLHFQQDGGILRASVGRGAFIKGDDFDALLAYARVRREVMTDDSLDVVRRAMDGGHCYFIVNRCARQWEGWVRLADAFRSVMIFNPMDGASGMGQSKSGNEVYLQLLPGESVIVRTEAASAEMYPYYRPAGGAWTLNGEWKVDFMEGGPVLPAPQRTRVLGTWTNFSGGEVKRFSGTAKYTLSFGRPARKASWWILDLGKVDVTARVVLNGRKLATLIGPYYRVVVADSSIHDRNLLEVYVSNGMANRIEDLDRRGVVWKKFYNYNFPAHVKENRGADGLFDASKWRPLDAGLSGPVTLTAAELSHRGVVPPGWR
jgi:Tol biopolymer transport system component